MRSIRYACVLSATLLAVSLLAQPAGSIDSGFLPGDTGYGTGVGGSVFEGDKVVVLPDGRMMVGGFQMGHNLSATKNVMRLNADGTVDPSFNMVYDPDARCFAVQPDGKVVVGGSGLLKRFNADGSTDPSFDVGDMLAPVPGSMVYPEGTVLDLYVYTDGRIMASGYFSAVNGAPTFGLVRFTADGFIEAIADLGYQMEYPVEAFVVNETTGFVIVSADFTHPAQPGGTPLARFHADLSLDALMSGITGSFHSFHPQPNGGIIFAGSALASGTGYATAHVGRLNADGTLDTSFAPPTFGGTAFLATFGIAVQPDNKVLAGGTFTMVDGLPKEYLVRLEPDGSLDNTFHIGLNDPTKVDTEFAPSIITAIAVQADDRIVTAGSSFYFGNRARRGMARFMPDGELDNDFNPSLGASDPVRALVRRPNGRIIVGGDFIAIGDSARGCIAQVLPDGTVDPMFPSGAGVGRAPFAEGSVSCLDLRPDGSLLVGGRFLRFHGQPVTHLVRLLPNGSLDPDFQLPLINGAVESIAVQPDGRILIGGTMGTVQGVPRRRVARLMPNGTLDMDFDPGQGFDPQVSSVNCMLVLPDGRILLGGSFSSYDGVPASNIVRLLSNGAIDPTFSTMPGANGSVEDMLLMPNGDIMLAGGFTSFNGSERQNVARLDTDGQLTAWTGFGAPTHPQGMCTLALQPDGKLLVGGHAVTGPGGAYQRRGVVRVMPGGGIDDTFDVGDGFGLSPTGTPFRVVLALVVDDQGGIIAGGDFTSINGTGRNYIARLYLGVSVGDVQLSLDPAFGLYPNPSDGLLTIDLRDTSITLTHLRMLAADGRMVLQQRLSAPRTQLDVQRLPAGSYTVELINGAGVRQVQRFVKQ